MNRNDFPIGRATLPGLPATVLACLGCAVLVAGASASDEVPGAPQDRPIALVGGTVHPVSSEPIENGFVVFDGGRIVAIGRGRRLPQLEGEVQVIDVTGKHVYPGLFEAHSQVGLAEISSVRATIDHTETGSLNPNVEARVAVNPDSEVIPVTRANGVLLAVSAPSGGLISGKSAVLQLDGWTFEDLTLEPRVGLHVNWPRIAPVVRLPGSDEPQRTRGGRGGGGEGADDPLRPLREFFDDARAYQTDRAVRGDATPLDLRLEAMGEVLDGTLPMIVAADGIDEIQSAVAFALEEDVRLILFGGYDAPRCADLLRRHDVPVIVSAVHRVPRRRHDAYDDAYTLPERLRQAEIEFCISGSERDETWNSRNLPYHAATAVAYGLPHDEGLKAITLYPARILGVDDRVGSLEVGKDATLIVTDGDPLETTTQVLAAYVQGRSVQLTSRHTRLYEKYGEKYRRQREER